MEIVPFVLCHSQNRFRLTVQPSELAGLKNAEFKNSYTLHATLPHQVKYSGLGSQHQKKTVHIPVLHEREEGPP